MSWETELKLRVSSHDPVRERLRQHGAVSAGKVLEVNDIFDRPNGALRRRGVGLRIRTVRAETGGGESTIFTVKGARVPGALKTREEVEFPVPNAETATRAMNLLGFVRVLRYQKRRESWRLGECLVELDEPPHIGLFVEIEGPTEADVTEAKSELGLASAETITKSYIHMLRVVCEASGIIPDHIRFR